MKSLTPIKKNTLWLLIVDGVQLSQDYKAATRRQFTFYHQVPRRSCDLFDQPRKDERLSRLWNNPVVLNLGLLDLKFSALTTRPLLDNLVFLSLTSQQIQGIALKMSQLRL